MFTFYMKHNTNMVYQIVTFTDVMKWVTHLALNSQAMVQPQTEAACTQLTKLFILPTWLGNQYVPGTSSVLLIRHTLSYNIKAWVYTIL